MGKPSDIDSETKISVQKGKDFTLIKEESQLVTEDTYHLKQQISSEKLRLKACTRNPGNMLPSVCYPEDCSGLTADHSKEQDHTCEYNPSFSNTVAISNLLDKGNVAVNTDSPSNYLPLQPFATNIPFAQPKSENSFIQLTNEVKTIEHMLNKSRAILSQPVLKFEVSTK